MHDVEAVAAAAEDRVGHDPHVRRRDPGDAIAHTPTPPVEVDGAPGPTEMGCPEHRKGRGGDREDDDLGGGRSGGSVLRSDG